MTEYFFEKDRDDHAIYHPTSSARGPWDPDSLHGRVISGLIAYESESVSYTHLTLPTILVV